ncbi:MULTISPECIES: DUF7490 domain-containing protein [Haloarcula]|uniref:DUF7490 domain-containing protein n=1 Tax=Haloarcula TaxID=2237 RepID=UPI0023EC1633|nr:PGF-CTERM sorting domain-containing protein [Halomicroarcula sp. XH51]
MRREVTLALAMVLLALAMVVGATAVPDVLTEPDEDIRPSHLDLRETTVNATDVGGESVTLVLDSRIAHRGGTARNVTVETRVVDAETGLVTTTRRQSLGNVTGEREVSVETELTVEREGGYRIETLVFADGERRTTSRTEVRNVDALTPAYARSSVSFHRFEGSAAGLRPIAYRIQSVADNRTTLNVSVYFTNRGDEPAGDLTLRLRARQADSNVVADETRLRVGQIRPGRTETVTAELTVPDGYNYWLDGILLSDGVIVATESAPANLDPQETLAVNETRRDVGFQSGDFAEEPERERATEAPARESTVGGSGPGFTAVAALTALLAGTIALARRRL